jgi:hypothetical protein
MKRDRAYRSTGNECDLIWVRLRKEKGGRNVDQLKPEICEEICNFEKLRRKSANL